MAKLGHTLEEPSGHMNPSLQSAAYDIRSPIFKFIKFRGREVEVFKLLSLHPKTYDSRL